MIFIELAGKRGTLFHIAAVCFAINISCSQAGFAPENTVTKFIQAINDKDIDRLLTCVDPKQERMFRATYRIVERFTGFPLDDLFAIIPGMYQILQTRSPEDFGLSDVRFVGRNLYQSAAGITVSFTVRIRTRSEQLIEKRSALFILSEFDEGWRIVELQNLEK